VIDAPKQVVDIPNLQVSRFWLAFRATQRIGPTRRTSSEITRPPAARNPDPP